MRVLVGRHLQRDALVQRAAGDPVEVAAGHLQDRRCRRPAARCTASATRSSDGGAHRDVSDSVAARPRGGTRPPGCGRARSPVVSPCAGWLRPDAAVGALRAACLAARGGRRCAGWPLRISAGGVGPLPSSARRRWPPEPTTIPFFVPSLRIAPRRLGVACHVCYASFSDQVGPSGMSSTAIPAAVSRSAHRRRRPRSRGGRGHPAAARAGRPPGRPALPTPPRLASAAAQCGSSGSRPSTPVIARTDDRRSRARRRGRPRRARCCPRGRCRARPPARRACPGRRPSAPRTPAHRAPARARRPARRTRCTNDSIRR